MTTTIELPKISDDTISLFNVGCLINLRVGTWSARRMLTREDMVSMDVDPHNLPEDLVNPGRKLLVPKAELQLLTHLEQKARKYLEKWSVPFGISNCHFVPINLLNDVEQELSSTKDAFFREVDNFIGRFSEMREVMQESYGEFWEKCLKHLYPANPRLLRQKFKFEWHMFRIAGLNSIQETSVIDAMAQADIRKEKSNELRSQMQNQVSDFVENYVSTMRQETVNFCKLMSARINEQPFGDETEPKKFTARAFTMFRNHVKKFQTMNIFGDTEIATMLSKFEERFLDEHVSPSDFDCTEMKYAVTTELAKITKQAEDEGEFLGKLKRRVII